MHITINEHMRHFNLLSSEIDSAYHEASLKLGISDSVGLILYTAYCYGGECLLSDITLMTGASKQTINSALRKLEAGDFVYLKTFEGRKKKLFLTDKGKKLACETVSHLVEIENQIFESWSDEEVSLYIELTQRYLTTFKEKIRNL